MAAVCAWPTASILSSWRDISGKRGKWALPGTASSGPTLPSTAAWQIALPDYFVRTMPGVLSIWSARGGASPPAAAPRTTAAERKPCKALPSRPGGPAACRPCPPPQEALRAGQHVAAAGLSHSRRRRGRLRWRDAARLATRQSAAKAPSASNHARAPTRRALPKRSLTHSAAAGGPRSSIRRPYRTACHLKGLSPSSPTSGRCSCRAGGTPGTSRPSR